MKGGAEIVLTRSEVERLHEFMRTQGGARTYRIQRDTANVLWIVEPSGRLVRLTRERVA